MIFSESNVELTPLRINAVATSRRAGSQAPTFITRWAVTPCEIAAAQRLRYRIFGEEMGVQLLRSPGRPTGYDVDEFDEHCLHLLVFTTAEFGTRADEVIATCRILMPDGARRIGRYYCDDEFDLSPLCDLLPGAVEMGRVCVDLAWRNGLLILAMWREIGQLMKQEGLGTLIGCTSVRIAGNRELAGKLWQSLQSRHLVESARRVRPWNPLSLELSEGTDVQIPPLMKGYLRCGGRLLGPPAYDAKFRCADFPMMLRLDDLPSRYSNRVLKS